MYLGQPCKAHCRRPQHTMLLLIDKINNIRYIRSIDKVKTKYGIKKIRSMDKAKNKYGIRKSNQLTLEKFTALDIHISVESSKASNLVLNHLRSSSVSFTYQSSWFSC